MEKYLARLHKRPDHHKKRFAFLASSTITLFIFGVWSLATFGVNNVSEEIVIEKNEIGPFELLRTNLGSSFEAIQTIYKEMRDNAPNIYGR